MQIVFDFSAKTISGQNRIPGEVLFGIDQSEVFPDYIPMRSRFPKKPPPWVEMSTKIARMRNSQSQKPAIGNRMTYIKVVQGKTIIPKIGQMIELNAEIGVSPTQRTGLMIHQITLATRGPKRTNIVKKQHIAILLDDDYVPRVL